MEFLAAREKKSQWANRASIVLFSANRRLSTSALVCQTMGDARFDAGGMWQVRPASALGEELCGNRNPEEQRGLELKGRRRALGGVAAMCDYSLEHVASRPARVGDKLVSTRFINSGTRGFAASDEPTVAVCLLPGTELAFDEQVKCESMFGSAPRGYPTG